MREPRGPALDTAVPAMTLKVGDYVNHHGGLAVTRSLGRLGVPVFGVHEDRFAPAGLSRFAVGRFVWRTSSEGSYQRQLLDGIASVGERIGRPTVLIPTDDHAVLFIADNADLLRSWFLFPSLPPELVRTVTDKARLVQRCSELGVDVPVGRVVTNADELAAFAATATLPVVAKRSAPLLLDTGRRATSTTIVTSPVQLAAIDVSTPVLLQERIPADHGEDWLFHGYCDHESDCVLAFTGRKLRSFPPAAGETAFGVSEANPSLEDEMRRLCKGLGYRGIMSLDIRFDRRDGRYKLLDFNPRTGAIFRLFETETGVDVVRALHLGMTGRSIPAGRPVFGRRVAVEGYDVRSCAAHLKSGAMGLRECVGSWRSVDEPAWLAVDDLVPPAVAVGRLAWDAVRRRATAGHTSVESFTTSPPRFLSGRAPSAARGTPCRRAAS